MNILHFYNFGADHFLIGVAILLNWLWGNEHLWYINLSSIYLLSGSCSPIHHFLRFIQSAVMKVCDLVVRVFRLPPQDHSFNSQPHSVLCSWAKHYIPCCSISFSCKLGDSDMDWHSVQEEFTTDLMYLYCHVKNQVINPFNPEMRMSCGSWGGICRCTCFLHLALLNCSAKSCVEPFTHRPSPWNHKLMSSCLIGIYSINLVKMKDKANHGSVQSQDAKPEEMLLRIVSGTVTIC